MRGDVVRVSYSKPRPPLVLQTKGVKLDLLSLPLMQTTTGLGLNILSDSALGTDCHSFTLIAPREQRSSHFLMCVDYGLG